ncbi:MAG TPA: hypothetical protein DEA45_02770 [Acholeplasmataceae bacterium]|nr:hypothetical protein [Acholeplasmataceae bacterium]
MYQLEDIKNKIYNQGRDLEVALFNHYFLDDDKEMVSYALSIYQNEDGGFAYGLEPDNTNPNSSSFQTSYALELLVNIGYKSDTLDEFTKEMVYNAVQFLKTQLKDDLWLATIPSNNEVSCAIWWKHQEGVNAFLENPTVSIIGTLLQLLDETDDFYQTLIKLQTKYYQHFLSTKIDDKHLLACYIHFYHGLKKTKQFDLVPFYTKLSNEIIESIDSFETWNEGYVTTPFSYPLYEETYGIEDKLIKQNLEYLEKTYVHNHWNINFTWMNEDEGFDVQAIKWQAIITIHNLRLIKKYQESVVF